MTYGIHRNSILNSSKYFHVVSGLPPDIMHDILEGSLQYEVKELLKYLIREEKLLSLNDLNQKIQLFPYVQCDKVNKPAIISENCFSSSSHSLKQTGVYY